MQPKDIVDLGLYWDEWSRCLNFSYQRDQYYRFGKFEDCSDRWDDVWKALEAKVSRDKAHAIALMETTHYNRSRKKSPTMGAIWEAKDPPSWD